MVHMHTIVIVVYIKKVERERDQQYGSRVVLLPLRNAPPDNYCGGTVGESPQAGELF